MNTNPMTGSAYNDDFDVCCGTGFYRRHVEVYTPTHAKSGSTTTYDAVRPAYAFGHRAASNPSYVGRSFEEVEADLRQDTRRRRALSSPCATMCARVSSGRRSSARSRSLPEGGGPGRRSTRRSLR